MMMFDRRARRDVAKLSNPFPHPSFAARVARLCSAAISKG